MNGLPRFFVPVAAMLAIVANSALPSVASADPAIVLPRDYPMTDEPVRSGVPIGHYFRMLRDNDPAYRIFAMGQLTNFELADEPGPFGNAAINDRLERIAREDAHPAPRVVALYLLVDRGVPQSESLARAMFESFEPGTHAWEMTLSYLLCVAPDEYLPTVRERALLMDMVNAHRWYSAMAQLMPFDEFVTLLEDVAVSELERTIETIHDATHFTRLPQDIAKHPTSFLPHLGLAYAAQMERTGDDPVAMQQALHASQRMIVRIVRIAAEACFDDEVAMQAHARSFEPARTRQPPSSDMRTRLAQILDNLSVTTATLPHQGYGGEFSEWMFMGFMEGIESAAVPTKHRHTRDRLVLQYRTGFDTALASQDASDPKHSLRTALLTAKRSQGGHIRALLDDPTNRRLNALLTSVSDHARSISGVMLAPCWDDPDDPRHRARLR